MVTRFAICADIFGDSNTRTPLLILRMPDGRAGVGSVVAATKAAKRNSQTIGMRISISSGDLSLEHGVIRYAIRAKRSPIDPHDVSAPPDPIRIGWD